MQRCSRAWQKRNSRCDFNPFSLQTIHSHPIAMKIQRTKRPKTHGKPKGKTFRRIITPGAKGYLRAADKKPNTPKIKFQAQPKPADPEAQYRAQVKSLEASIAAANVLESLKPALSNHQLKLAQVHREWVVNGLGFNPDLAKLGFFVAGPNGHQRSLEGRRIWEAADALTRAARANGRRRPQAP